MKDVKCPTCKKQTPWDKNNPYRPFCNERCKMIDLGSWADGSYAIPTNESVSSTSGNDGSISDDKD